MSLTKKDKKAVKTFWDKAAGDADEIGNDALSRHAHLNVI